MVLLESQTRCTNARRINFEDLNHSIFTYISLDVYEQRKCMNLNEYVTLVHIVPPEPCPLVPPDMGCVKSCITSAHNNFRYFLLFMLYTQCQAPTVSSRFKEIHSIYMILEGTYFTLFSFGRHHRLVAM